MGTFENYIIIKLYNVYKDNIDLILIWFDLIILGRVCQTWCQNSNFRDQNQIKLCINKIKLQHEIFGKTLYCINLGNLCFTTGVTLEGIKVLRITSWFICQKKKKVLYIGAAEIDLRHFTILSNSNLVEPNRQNIKIW